jgi:hypothetical protein
MLLAQVLVWAKSPVVEIPMIAAVTPPVLVTFKVRARLVVASFCGPNFKLAGEIDNAPGVGVAVGVGESVAVGVGVVVGVAAVGVGVAVLVAVAVRVALAVGVGVALAVAVGVAHAAGVADAEFPTRKTCAWYV